MHISINENFIQINLKKGDENFNLTVNSLSLVLI